MRIPVPVYVGVVVASAIISTFLWRELRSERQALQAERQLTDQQRTKLAEADGDRASSPPVQLVTEIAPVPAEVLPQPAMNVKPPNDVARLVAASAKRQKSLLDNPEYHKARLAEVRATLKERNPVLAQELGISERDADAIYTMLAENQLREEAQAAGLAASGTPPDAAAIAEMTRLQRAQQQEQQDKFVLMLGQTRYEQLQGIQQTQPARTRVSNVKTLLAQSGQPLTSDQLLSLTKVMAAQQKREEKESQDQRAAGQTNLVSQLDRAVEGDRRILDNAAGFLSAQQLDAMRARFEQRQAKERATGVIQARERALGR